MSKWINVKESLPENDPRTELLFVFETKVFVGKYFDDAFQLGVITIFSPYVSHWQPFPEPPKED